MISTEAYLRLGTITNSSSGMEEENVSRHREYAINLISSEAFRCQSSSLLAPLAQRNMMLSEPASAVLPILKSKKMCVDKYSEMLL